MAADKFLSDRMCISVIWVLVRNLFAFLYNENLKLLEIICLRTCPFNLSVFNPTNLTKGIFLTGFT